MKAPIQFLVGGLAIGLAVGWFMGSQSSSKATPVAMESKTERPAVRTASASVASSAHEEKRVTRSERPEKSGEPNKPEVKVFTAGAEMSPEAKEAMAKMHEQMRELMKEKRARRIDERLAALKTRLNLTPDQEAKVKELLEKSPDMDGGIMQIRPGEGVQGGAFSLSTAVARNESRQATEDQLAALLNPEQKEAFQTFQQEQRENRAEIATNREMAQLQQQLTLTPEQKDKAFQALGDLARKEDTQPANMFDPASIQAKRQARLDAMRPILTPEQMKSYEASPMMPVTGLGEAVSIQFSSPEVPAKSK